VIRVLVATDAWHPQVNGVVRTLSSLSQSARRLGVEIEFLTPEGFPSLPLPTYPGLRLALAVPHQVTQRIQLTSPDAIHIATEGPIGHVVRRYCRSVARPFTTSYTTRFPEYISARAPIPQSWIYAGLRRFHAAANLTMVATQSLLLELTQRGFSNLAIWTRGVDTELFKPERRIELGFERPIFINVGRVAVEKNLEAFLSLDLPGTKLVVGAGPQEAELKRQFPRAKFLGVLEPQSVAAHLAAADVFVFPSRTDTFGIVQLEALACGVPIAAFPVTGPKDVVANHPIGVLNEDLRLACLGALRIPRASCRAFAVGRSWENSARQFISHVQNVLAGSRANAGCDAEHRAPASTLPVKAA
jgi:glycosyltransferase involved in cell wall biosynthesis